MVIGDFFRRGYRAKGYCFAGEVLLFGMCIIAFTPMPFAHSFVAHFSRFFFILSSNITRLDRGYWRFLLAWVQGKGLQFRWRELGSSPTIELRRHNIKESAASSSRSQRRQK